MVRTSNLELPSADELRTMIQKESPRRAVKRDYLVRHAEVFDGLRAVARKADIDIGVFDGYAQLPFNTTIDRLHQVVDELEQFLSQPAQYEFASRLYGPLNCVTSAQSSSLLLVLGSPKNLRIEKAIELYQAGIAPKMMTTGSAPHWGASDMPEAKRAANYALQHGVPAADIIIEDQSISVPDNVKCSIDMLEAMEWQPSSITLVTSAFNARRATMDVYKFTPWDIEIFAAAPVPSAALNMHNCITTERGRRIILNEYAKLIIESKIDQALAEGNYE